MQNENPDDWDFTLAPTLSRQGRGRGFFGFGDAEQGRRQSEQGQKRAGRQYSWTASPYVKDLSKLSAFFPTIDGKALDRDCRNMQSTSVAEKDATKFARAVL
jgi:hypothetical protein